MNAPSSLKVLVLASTFPRWQGDKEPPFVYELSRRLVQHPHIANVHVLAPHAQGAALTEEWEGLKITRFRYFFEKWQTLAYAGGILANLKQNRWRYALVPFFMLGEAIALWRLLRRESFDVIHAHWLIPQGLIALLVCKLLPRPVPKILCTSHGGDLFALRGKGLTQLKTYVLKNVSAMTVVSEAMFQEALRLGADAQKMYVIPMGVDVQTQFIPNATCTRHADSLLFVGRLVEKKGIHYLLQAMPTVLARYPHVQLRIIGTGTEAKALQDLAQQLQIVPHVQFIGAVENKNLPQLYQSHAIVIFPSIIANDGDREGFGLVLVEALGCECAVIATDLPAMQDILQDQQTALIVPQRDVSALAEALCTLLANPAKARQLGEQGRQFVVARYDWQIIAQRYGQLLVEMG
ncbi:glycosyltransferase [Beggiatoa alba B18LD]|uniref:Glycosyltransferase n=1 Tax=Beggiatoa alba B18LD TaxID=395493 RepID=I3CCT3_9GAMM|nr:glycosyltransferase family 4 protein [Beggiatoa alba]EIJ41426.1 glycosyltransferase [Beggiatoa alba B18LD]